MHSALVCPPYAQLLDTPRGTPVTLEPLGVEYVVAAARAGGFDCDIVARPPADSTDAAQQLATESYDLVAVSAATPVLPWVLQVVAELRLARPETVIVLGGDHASSCPAVVRQDCIDYAVVGEGEVALPALLRALCSEMPLERVPGLARKVNGKPGWVGNGRAIVQDLDVLPWPVRNTELLRSCRVDGLTYPAPSQQSATAQVVFSRGCVHACDFCASRNVFGDGIRLRSPQAVVAEMASLRRDHGVDLLYFADLHLGARNSALLELCRLLKQSEDQVPWYGATTIASLSDDVCQAMVEAGCSKVCLGIESMHPGTHRRLRPWSDVHKAGDAVRQADMAGLLVRAYYMIGIPGETRDEFRQGIEALVKLPVDELRIAYYTPFPGTPAYEQTKDQLLTDDFARYTSGEPILDLAEFPPDQQREEYEWAFERFYNGPEYAARWQRKVARRPRFEQSYADFLKSLATNGLMAGGFP